MDMTAIGNEYSHFALNLLGVIALILALMYLLKKIKFSKIANNKYIKIINTIPIGTKEKIILIEVNKTMLLIGATPSHIETLYVFNEAESDTLPISENVDSGNTFSEQMNLMKKSM